MLGAHREIDGLVDAGLDEAEDIDDVSTDSTGSGFVFRLTLAQAVELGFDHDEISEMVETWLSEQKHSLGGPTAGEPTAKQVQAELDRLGVDISVAQVAKRV